MTSPIDLARAEAEKLLPCNDMPDDHHNGSHSPRCPARYHEPVAQAIAAVIVERDSEWNKAIDEAAGLLDQTSSDILVRAAEHPPSGLLRPLLQQSADIAAHYASGIRALRRPDAPANTEMPGEDVKFFSRDIPGRTDPESLDTPTIEELRDNVVEAAESYVMDDFGDQLKIERLVLAVQALQSKERDLG